MFALILPKINYLKKSNKQSENFLIYEKTMIKKIYIY